MVLTGVVPGVKVRLNHSCCVLPAQPDGFSHRMPYTSTLLLPEMWIFPLAPPQPSRKVRVINESAGLVCGATELAGCGAALAVRAGAPNRTANAGIMTSSSRAKGRRNIRFILSQRVANNRSALRGGAAYAK